MHPDSFFHYMLDQAPLLFFRIGNNGHIKTMNPYAVRVCGEDLLGKAFKDVVLDFKDSFDLLELSKTSPEGHLLHINTVSGFPQSYIFSFHPMDSEILALGHLDTKDVEKMQVDSMLLNQDLGNLNRELHKKNAQLQDALDHVKTLQGIIPICMHCHKIRDERQIWDRLEAYLSEHTSAELSHSICPDCMEKHYPEEDDDEAE
jgi:hypothetical protein